MIQTIVGTVAMDILVLLKKKSEKWDAATRVCLAADNGQYSRIKHYSMIAISYLREQNLKPKPDYKCYRILKGKTKYKVKGK